MDKKSNIPKTVHDNSPCLMAERPFTTSPAASASATNGVIAVENPIPNDIAIKIKLFPRDTAANSAVHN